MKITSEQLKRLIREEYASFGIGDKKPTRFLHGEDPEDSEGGMALGQLSDICRMSEELEEILNSEDQLPGWVQNHLTVSHENLRQIHGYLTNAEGRNKK
jgi:hypothetical protein